MMEIIKTELNFGIQYTNMHLLDEFEKLLISFTQT